MGNTMSNMMKTGKLEKRATIHVEVTSNTSGEKYEGDFTWRRRRLEDIGKISQIQSELTGGAPIVDGVFRSILTAISELTVVVEKYPDWWEEIKDIPDTGVISRVYTRYLEWLNEPFRSKVGAVAPVDSSKDETGNVQDNPGEK